MKCLLKSARLIRYFDREFFYISNKTNCKWKQFWLGQHKYYEKVKQITTFCIEIMTPTQITRTHLWNQDMIETSMWFWSVSLANQSSGQFLIFLGSAKKIVHSQTGHFFCWPTKKRRNWPDNWSNAYPRKSTTILYLIQILRFLNFFPPSYVVTKLTYSHRFLMRKYS